jgi:hypothetical protein
MGDALFRVLAWNFLNGVLSVCCDTGQQNENQQCNEFFHVSPRLCLGQSLREVSVSQTK